MSDPTIDAAQAALTQVGAAKAALATVLAFRDRIAKLDTVVANVVDPDSGAYSEFSSSVPVSIVLPYIQAQVDSLTLQAQQATVALATAVDLITKATQT